MIILQWCKMQIMFPESLVSCIALMMVIISIYLNMENPAIRRTSAYAVLIAENLRKNKKYENVITKDYIDNLAESAPMHDIGKIGIF